MNKRFREMYGDELADLVEKVSKKRSGVEVLKPKPKQSEPEQQPEQDERWWDR
jgi:hypothetical protein